MIFLIRFCTRRSLSSAIDLGSQIKKLNDNGQFQKAIALYEDQVEKQCKKNSTFIVNQALTACVKLGDIERGKDIHKNLSSYMINNPHVENGLIRLYMKINDYEKSKQIFENSKNKTTAMFNSILKGLADNNRREEALTLLKQTKIAKNEYTYSILFKICSEIGNEHSLEFGKLTFDKMPKIFYNNIVVMTSALQLFFKSGEISKAEQLFNQIENKDSMTFAIMMNGFVLNKMEDRAIDLFFKVNRPNQVIYGILFNACARLKSEHALNLGKKAFDQLVVGSTLFNNLSNLVLNMFVKCDDLKSAESLFDKINRDIICYVLIMKLYNIKNQAEKTLELFERMKKEKLNPNGNIFALLIDALSKLGDLSLSQSFIDEIPENFLSDPWIQTGLVDLWGKLGEPNKSKEIFDTIQHPNNVLFAAMINAYGLNGMGIEAVELFNKIPSDMLDDCIYVCVLNACSHSALVEQAWKIFEKIPDNQRIAQIYTTMIDTLSRVFLFDQAQELIDQYEKTHRPYIPMYMSILSSTRNAKNSLLSKKIFHSMETKFSNNESALTAAQVLLANTYALSGDKSMAYDVRMKYNNPNIKKVVGCTSTVVNGKIHTFRAHDRSHPCSSEIYQELDRLKEKLFQFGYKPDGSWITRDLNNGETIETALCGHSERLAIIFNLIQRPIPTRIQIVKNLRICGDCHSVTKLIAQIYQCSIIVRDANRIHHFHPNGKCSCQDHF